MSTKPQKTYRKKRLFPRTLSDVVKEATKPFMDKQGKLYGALLRDWSQIVGEERARLTRPQRLQFVTQEASGAILHIEARPHAAPELSYATEQMLEQCARYFGYRAIARIVIHATHHGFEQEEMVATSAPKPLAEQPLPARVPDEMRAAFARIAAHIASASDKKN
jgi:hypothetical protein